MKSNSQAGQDLFVLLQFPKGYKGMFVDIGCNKPDTLNNTLLLEQNGWIGWSFDITDYSRLWKWRKTSFICIDALEVNYTQYLPQKEMDYLSLDIEGVGNRFLALKRIIDYGYVFRVITIEHDAYRKGHNEAERIPQRKFLQEQGYYLAYPDVKNDGLEFEDWWIHKKLIMHEK